MFCGIDNNISLPQKMLDYDELAVKTNWSYDYLLDIDTSQFPFPNTLWHVKSPKEIALKTTPMLIIGVFGIFLNSVILITLAKNRWLWTASNYLIGNLAVTDLMTLLFCPWFMLVRDFYQNYVLKNFGCRFEGFMQATMLLAAVGAVMLVCYDRMAAAALTADARVTKSAAPKLIIISWVAAILLSLPWIIKREYVERQWLDHLETYCVEDVKFLGIYWHFTLSMLVWIPLGVMVLTYGTIMWKLEWSARRLRGSGLTAARARRRAMRITACVLLAAVFCRLPYTLLIYWRNNNSMTINSVDGIFSIIWFAGNLLMYFNSAINPLIYGFTNLRFRRAMDRTPGIACCRFGSWCCVCAMLKRKQTPPSVGDKNSEKIFVIENSPKPNRKLTKAIKNVLRINKDTLELSIPKADDITGKPTKVTPLKPDN
ncbi:red-sensitive opsin [Cydia amplana]|uniref:red-sensitive opsin n=1 Tax=Cydia amplana TaxID=1869771 RepID=UPI002FE4FDAC